MKRILKKYKYWVDPHTGVALAAAEQMGHFDSEDSNNENISATHVAIFSTAAPCKFQLAVTTAIGKEAWDEYEQNHFPSRGKYLNDMEEQPPLLYAAEPGKTLEENQILWEEKAWKLIDLLG
jgi:threonine synthase